MNIGDYVRTKNIIFQPSQIAKITDMKKDEGYKNQYFITLDHNLPATYNFHIYSEDVIKSSSNIIDLIEVGDYVNGCHITYIAEPDKYNSNRILYFEEPQDYVLKTFTNEEIKSVVTKEQFESIKYNVGGKE